MFKKIKFFNWFYEVYFYFKDVCKFGFWFIYGILECFVCFVGLYLNNFGVFKCIECFFLKLIDMEGINDELFC